MKKARYVTDGLFRDALRSALRGEEQLEREQIIATEAKSLAYLGRVRGRFDGPKRTELKALRNGLLDLQTKAVKLVKHIDDNVSPPNDARVKALSKSLPSYRTFLERFVESCDTKIDQLQEVINAAPTGGRPVKEYARRVALECRKSFERLTEREGKLSRDAYTNEVTGRFFELVERIFEILSIDADPESTVKGLDQAERSKKRLDLAKSARKMRSHNSL